MKLGVYAVLDDKLGGIVLIRKQKQIMATLYPIGIRNFESLRKDGFLYVDKTALIYQLVQTGSYYFLSRPRRFGKSLLISTLEAYFQGKKELFKGLAIELLEKDWVAYPLLHINLNISNTNSGRTWRIY